MHRRKSSKEDVDDGDTFVLVPPPDAPTVSTPILTAPPNPSRHRNHSTPNVTPPQLGPGLVAPSLQPLARRPPSISLNSPPTSPFRVSHARVRSISSGPFMPPVSSPLASNFHVPLHPFEPGPSLQVESAEGINETSINGASHGHGRRHSRLHSRNLSIFFPRQHATISEDTISDVESAPLSPINQSQSKSELIPASQSEPLQIGRELSASFSFGSSASSTIPTSNSTSGITTRRGHHHKHSLSHNFFSFLDPSAPPPETRPEELHAAPTLAPMSPWSPVSNLQGAGGTSPTMVDLATGTSSRSPSPATSSSSYTYTYSSYLFWNLSKDGLVAWLVCVLQFCLGALVWVRGQATGSLACTGLGYWVVFDAFGIAVGGPLVGKCKGGFL